MNNKPAASDVDAITAIVQQLITQQGLTTGSKLPSVRELSAELGFNRNTVYSAYKKLQAENVITIRRGSGVYINTTPPKTADTDNVKEELWKYLVVARLSGLEKEDAQVMILNILNEVYQSQTPEILFAECNTYDSETIRSELMMTLPVKVVPVELDIALKNPGMLQDYPIVCTTYYHINELKQLDYNGKLIALHHAPSPKCVHQIAEISRGSKLGIIASNERTLSVIKGLVMMFNHTQTNECLSEDKEAVQRTIAESDIIITNFNALSEIEKSEHKLPIIMVQFHIEPDSIQYLKEELTSLKSNRRVQNEG